MKLCTPVKKLLEEKDDTLELLEKRGKKPSPKFKSWSPLPRDRKSLAKLPATTCPNCEDFMAGYEPTLKEACLLHVYVGKMQFTQTVDIFFR